MGVPPVHPAAQAASARARRPRHEQMQEFIQQLINGLSQGSIYALIAVGYTMVYGVLQLINFAHGDVFMVGAMVSLYAATGRIPPALPWWLHALVIVAF